MGSTGKTCAVTLGSGFLCYMEVAMLTPIPSSLLRTIAVTLMGGAFISVAGCSDALVNTRESRNQGIQQYRDGEYAEAAGTFRNTIRSNPADYGSHYFLGACMAKLGSYEQAIEQYKTCVELMNDSMVGRDDKVFRMQALQSLAEAVVGAKDRDYQSILIKTSPPFENQLLLAKINRGMGDADAALENYSQAALLAPKEFEIHKEYGLYLLQLSQEEKARAELRHAYALNNKDAQVASGLRQVGVVPGPSLKEENDLARPIIPVGPIPEVQITIPASDRTSAGSSPALE